MRFRYSCNTMAFVLSLSYFSLSLSLLMPGVRMEVMSGVTECETCVTVNGALYCIVQCHPGLRWICGPSAWCASWYVYPEACAALQFHLRSSATQCSQLQFLYVLSQDCPHDLKKKRLQVSARIIFSRLEVSTPFLAF